ncbi:internalin, partial [Kitasatospora sp. NPDC056327]
VWNGDARASTGTLDYSAPVLTWTGTLPAGATATVTYSVTVAREPAGDRALRNTVTSPDRTDCPLPAAARRAAAAPNCETVTPVRSLRLTKTATPAEARPGEKVDYRVSVTNTGTAPYDRAAFTDDLTGVLGAAVWNGDARASVGTLDYTAPVLTWTGALPAGATATVTYSVTVRPDATAARTLRNTVTSSTPGANCADPSDPGCGTRTPVLPPVAPPPVVPPVVPPVGPPSLPPTGDRATDLLPAVIALLTLGAALTALRRRSS